MPEQFPTVHTLIADFMIYAAISPNPKLALALYASTISQAIAQMSGASVDVTARASLTAVPEPLQSTEGLHT
jgi:hypothetical protein